MALLTATEAKAIKPDLSGSSQDTLLATLIVRADEVLAAWCGYPPNSDGGNPGFEAAVYTIYMDGPDTDNAQILRLPVSPINSITSVADDVDRVYGTAVDSDDYELDKNRGLVILKNTSTQGFWTSAWRSQKVVGSLGWATVPEGLKHAAAELVWHWYRLMRERGRETLSQGGASFTVIPSTVPDYVLEMVRPYRLHSVLV